MKHRLFYTSFIGKLLFLSHSLIQPFIAIFIPNYSQTEAQ